MSSFLIFLAVWFIIAIINCALSGAFSGTKNIPDGKRKASKIKIIVGFPVIILMAMIAFFLFILLAFFGYVTFEKRGENLSIIFLSKKIF